MLLEKYNPDWVIQFSTLKGIIEKALHGIQCRIEQVGSTAVPGLAAKPIIDMDIIYTQPDEFDKIKSGLEGIGYYHNGNQGIPERDVFKRNSLQGHPALDSIPHHLYVCPENSPAMKRHLLFRNYLRKHVGARNTYQQMKYELAEKAGQDKKIYARLKEETINGFIDQIIKKEITG